MSRTSGAKPAKCLIKFVIGVSTACTEPSARESAAGACEGRPRRRDMAVRYRGSISAPPRWPDRTPGPDRGRQLPADVSGGVDTAPAVRRANSTAPPQRREQADESTVVALVRRRRGRATSNSSPPRNQRVGGGIGTSPRAGRSGCQGLLPSTRRRRGSSCFSRAFTGDRPLSGPAAAHRPAWRRRVRRRWRKPVGPPRRPGGRSG